uniref:RED-like N-terminal domain-containing protein n=1 Tax=Fagus sylvatica TaxID=28930 RepID=A0A2N9HKE5_FAGSY
MEGGYSNDIPTTLHRSKADCPVPEEMVTVSVDGSVLDRIAKIMSYLRLGSSGKVLKKKKKERDAKESGLLSCIDMYVLSGHSAALLKWAFPLLVLSMMKRSRKPNGGMSKPNGGMSKNLLAKALNAIPESEFVPPPPPPLRNGKLILVIIHLEIQVITWGRFSKLSFP